MSRSSTDYTSFRKSVTTNFGEIWDIHTIVDVYQVERNDDAEMAPNEAELILTDSTTGGPVIPEIGSAWFVTGGTGTSWMESALCRRLSFRPNGRGMEVTAEFSTRYFQTDSAKALGPTVENMASATTLPLGLILPASVIPVIRTRSTRLLHDDYTANPPDTGNRSAAHIGGTIKNVDVDVKQVAMKLRLVVDVESLNLKDVAAIVVQYSGKRNTEEFLGFTTGQLLCEGVSVNHLEHEYYEVVLDITSDEWYFHSQEAALGTDGRPKMNDVNYEDVRWVREVRGAVDFNDIFPAGALGESQKWQCYKGIWF